MELAALGQSFDGGDLGAVEARSESEAGIDAPSVDQHGASAALASIAPLLAAGQIETLAQQVEQHYARIIEIDPAQTTIDGEADGKRHEGIPHSVFVMYELARQQGRWRGGPRRRNRRVLPE
ncbi:hypothetical protein GCM10007874_58000 [Labrys miyagiensis]|uniref:Uncharacterized protein n=1 Tax=Labrys miyagiensis TaxID=346912 RepID=A0ABQ6CUW2_9HYPH|nr:hypothetical protein GCM10007874_58000 [Labrys miyagiensis]